MRKVGGSVTNYKIEIPFPGRQGMLVQVGFNYNKAEPPTSDYPGSVKEIQFHSIEYGEKDIYFDLTYEEIMEIEKLCFTWINENRNTD